MSTTNAFVHGVLSLMTSLALAGCATSMDSGSHCAQDADALLGERTFAWSPDGAVNLIDESGYLSPTIVDQLKDRVAMELRTKGYELIDAEATGPSAAVTVQLYLRTRRELDSSDAYGHFVGPCVYPNCWQSPNDASVRFHTDTVGFLAADVYYNEKPIWRGWVERMLYPSDRDHAMQVIDEAVPRLFENFPVDGL